MEPYSTYSFSEQYDLPTESFEHSHVGDIDFSVRVQKRLFRLGIATVADLLRTSPASLMNTAGFGIGCLNEIERFLKGLEVGLIESPKESSNENISILKPYTVSLFRSVLNETPICQLDEHIDFSIENYRKAQETCVLLGHDFVRQCLDFPEYIQVLLDMFNQYDQSTKQHNDLQEVAARIPDYRLNSKAEPYVSAFANSTETKQALLQLINEEDPSIKGMVALRYFDDPQKIFLLKRFLCWSSFDLAERIHQIMVSAYKDKRAKTIIQGRAMGFTLEQLGILNDITRERVRQIERNTLKRFLHSTREFSILRVISAENGGKTIITHQDIERIYPDGAEELIYLMKGGFSTYSNYDDNFEIFVLGNDSVTERVAAFMERLPDVIKSSAVDTFFQQAEDEGIPAEIARKAFFDTYKSKGDVYHRTRLSLGSIYTSVISKYYPDGIYVYDPDEIAKLRRLITEEYGEVGLPENDRALSARVSSICILCGRGKYRVKQEHYISKTLERKINNYIKKSPNTVMMINTIYSVFEDELLKEGIDNRYYLQGILHEILNGQYVFTRDYISKDARTTSLYPEIIRFIRQSATPVSKQQIYAAFPGVTEIVINIATSDHSVLNYFGAYMHASNIRLSSSETVFLINELRRIVSDGNAHHSKEVYDAINRRAPELFTRNAALFQFSAFSLLEYLFGDEYQFSRPYIALKGVDIGRPAERLHDYIYSQDTINVSDITHFARENRMQIQSILEYVNSCNDEYLLVDRTTMVSISRIGITPEMAVSIDRLVSGRVSKTTAIKNMDIWGKLPKLNYPWTDWLMYSILKKWGSGVEVGLSSNQLKQAVPLVAPMGEIDPSTFKGTGVISSDGHIGIDDLDNIDDLIAGLIGEYDWEEEQ